MKLQALRAVFLSLAAGFAAGCKCSIVQPSPSWREAVVGPIVPVDTSAMDQKRCASEGTFYLEPAGLAGIATWVDDRHFIITTHQGSSATEWWSVDGRLVWAEEAAREQGAEDGTGAVLLRTVGAIGEVPDPPPCDFATPLRSDMRYVFPMPIPVEGAAHGQNNCWVVLDGSGQVAVPDRLLSGRYVALALPNCVTEDLRGSSGGPLVEVDADGAPTRIVGVVVGKLPLLHGSAIGRAFGERWAIIAIRPERLLDHRE